MNLLEKDVEDLFFRDLCTGGHVLQDRGVGFLCCMTGNKSVWYRQVNLHPYGIADIVGFSRLPGRIVIDIIELKVVNSNPAHFEQLFRYRTALKRILKAYDKNISWEIIPTLVVPYFDEGCYIQNYCGVDVIEYTYELDGFNFKNHQAKGGWHMVNENYDSKSLKKLISNGSLS